MQMPSEIMKQEVPKRIRALGYEPKFNVLTQAIETNGRLWADSDYDRLYIELKDIATDKYLKSMVSVMADDGKFNPLQDWINERIEANAWDGTDWIHKLCGYFENPDGMFETYLKKWMIGAVDKVMRGSERNPMLVLDGAQEKGKSRFVKWLCPPHLLAYYRDGQIYVNDKDYRMEEASTFIWEIGELDATTSKQEAAALKDFLTKIVVKDRPAYGRSKVQLPTITNFVGTFNNIYGFLNDATGSSRFRVCRLNKINWIGYTTDPDDLQSLIWDQAIAMWKNGETNQLNAEERKKMEEINRNYVLINNTLFALEEYFDIEPDTDYFCSSNLIWRTLRDHGLSGADIDAKRIASCLTSQGCRSGQKKIMGVNKRGWFGISKKVDVTDSRDIEII